MSDLFFLIKVPNMKFERFQKVSSVGQVNKRKVFHSRAENDGKVPLADGVIHSFLSRILCAL